MRRRGGREHHPALVVSDRDRRRILRAGEVLDQVELTTGQELVEPGVNKAADVVGQPEYRPGPQRPSVRLADRAVHAMDIMRGRFPEASLLVVAGGVASNAAVRAALDAVPDPVNGLLIYRGRGGGAGSRMPRKPKRPPASGAMELVEGPAERRLDLTGTG